ncbi:MAG: hypothetical protein PHY10_02330, partial [Patescibacteria group bacterium]|nr:hypothetical protein [Patescibacteria group bacterium]
MPILNKVSQLLFNRSKISADQFKKLNDEALANNVSPDEILERNHLVPEEDLVRAKSEVYGLPIADLFGLSVDKELLKILPKELA